MRSAGSVAEREALNLRTKAAFEDAQRRSATSEVEALRNAVSSGSSVVVSVPLAVARQLLADPRQLFENYENLVGTRRRVAAAEQNDRQRFGVAGIVFGTYGREIRYGVLALKTRGPASYGAVSCRLRDVTIRDRVSFLECNSFAFVEAHSLIPGRGFPAGYRAVWDNRSELAVAKLASRLLSGSSPDFDGLLMQCGDGSRAQDDFIEAHVFGPFNALAFADIEVRLESDAKKQDVMDARIVRELFRKLTVSPESTQ